MDGVLDPVAWREAPLLCGKFHPEYPDDIQVIVHDGGPRMTERQPEVMWVTITGCAGPNVYEGVLLNQPESLTHVREGDVILILAVATCSYPIFVTKEYLEDRLDWDIAPCQNCGFDELFDPPSVRHSKLFAMQAGATDIGFTCTCPICGGVQFASQKNSHWTEDIQTLRENDGANQATPMSGKMSSKRPWWRFWGK